MPCLKKSFLTATVLCTFLTAPAVHAQDPRTVEIPEDSPIADGKLDQEELGRAAAAGQHQLVRLTEQATEEYTESLKRDGKAVPAAWMLLGDGETIKRLNLGEQAKDAPANMRILMYRAALKSVARRGQINAAVILYTGKLDEDTAMDAIVIEHEHRLGISGNKVVPFELEAGKVSYFQSVTKEKPFMIFYDGQGSNPAGQS